MYPHRLHLVIAAEHRDAGNQAAVRATGNPADELTFSVPISPTGQEPATHYGSSTVVTEDLRVALWSEYAAGNVPGLNYWWLDSLSGQFVDSNIAGSTATDFDDCLAALGLKRVVFNEEEVI
jgi:hypothetical protein